MKRVLLTILQIPLYVLVFVLNVLKIALCVVRWIFKTFFYIISGGRVAG